MDNDAKGCRLANGSPGNIDRSDRSTHSQRSDRTQEPGYILEPLCSRHGNPDDAKADFYREFHNWTLWVLRQDLTDLHRCVGVLVIEHLSAKTGECFPSVPRLAAWLGRSENAVRDALKAIEALGGWSYPDNKGGRGCSSQFTFYVTPDQAEGLKHKPTKKVVRPARYRGGFKPKPSTQMKGINPAYTTGLEPIPSMQMKGIEPSVNQNPPSACTKPFKPETKTLHLLDDKTAKPSMQMEGNHLVENYKENYREPASFASQTTPMLESESQISGSKEGTSEGETVTSPPFQSVAPTRLELQERKLGPELSLIVRRSQIDYQERDGKLYVATSSADDVKAIHDNEDTIVDALRPDFPFACGIHAWVAS